MGIISDRYGRKWPLVCNLLFISFLELGVGFIQTFKQFLILRSLFGVGMGGIWGLAASTALENLPIEARGMASGFLQQGYACGYLFAALVSLLIVPEVKQGWRVMFWTASGLSFITSFLRSLLPESQHVLRAKEVERYFGIDTSSKTRAFLRNMKEMLKRHWALCIYSVLLMAGTCLSPMVVTILPFLTLCVIQDSTFSLMVLRYLVPITISEYDSTYPMVHHLGSISDLPGDNKGIHGA